MDRRQKRIKQEKLKKRKKEIFINGALIVLSVILLISLISFFKQRVEISKLKSSYDTQKEAQEVLKQRVEDLQKEIREVNTLEYIEKRAREDLGMIKEDETLYIDDENNEENNE